MLASLQKFSHIGWDFDGTLIEHPNSPLMHKFIKLHPEIEHTIITFRTHGLECRIFDDMRRLYQDAPPASCFTSVFSIADHAWERCSAIRNQRQMRLYNGPITAWERYYVTWKGKVCKQHDIPVLIDDNPTDVVAGCEIYGIKFIHPDELALTH